MATFAAVSSSMRAGAVLTETPPHTATAPVYSNEVADTFFYHSSTPQSSWLTLSSSLAAGATAAIVQRRGLRGGPLRSGSRIGRSAMDMIVTEAPPVIAFPTAKVEEEFEHKKAERYTLVLLNDPLSKREFVARCLMIICLLPEKDAYMTMMKAHTDSSAVVGVFPFEVAEMYMEGLKSKGLLVDMTPVEGDNA